jgi:MarR family transcriptional regulator for hemolysin
MIQYSAVNFKSKSSIGESLILTLFDIVNFLTKNSEVIALQGGLTVQQWLVLMQVADDSHFPQPLARPPSRAVGLHASEIADARGVSRPAISALVTALLRKGLVQQRENPEDRRHKILQITARGRRALENIEPLRQQVNTAFFRDFSADEMRQVHAFLQEWLARLWHPEDAQPVAKSGSRQPRETIK